MSVLCIIPARAGSKRIPDKNIKPLDGIPLIEHTIISAVSCESIDRVVVSSNIPSVSRYSAKYGTISCLDRPEYLCQDNTPDLAVITHAIKEHAALYCDDFNYYDLIVYLRPTTPFRADYHLTHAIQELKLADVNATGLRSVELMSESAYKCFEMPAFLAPICRDGHDLTDYPNQLVTPTYRPNGYIDICKPSVLARGSLWGDWVIGYVTPRTVEIDTMDDWDYAEYVAQRRVDQNIQFGKEIHNSP